MECLHCLRSHLYGLILQLGILIWDQVIQRLGNLGIALNKPPIESGGTQELTDSCHCLGGHHLSYSLHIVHARFHPLGGDMMAKVVDLLPKEVTLQWFQFQAMFPEPLKDCCQMLDVLLLSIWKDDDVVKLDQGIGQVKLP